MTRMIDEIADRGYLDHHQSGYQDGSLVADESVAIVVADNVYAYLDAITGGFDDFRGHNPTNLSGEYFCLTLPCFDMFVEHRCGQKGPICTLTPGMRGNFVTHRGYEVSSFDLEGDEFDAEWGHRYAKAYQIEPHEDTRWICTVKIFEKFARSIHIPKEAPGTNGVLKSVSVASTPWLVLYELDRDGKIISHGGRMLLHVTVVPPVKPEGLSEEEYIDYYKSIKNGHPLVGELMPFVLDPLFTTIDLMHCKGIPVKEQAPTKAQKKRARKKNKLTPSKFYYLDVSLVEQSAPRNESTRGSMKKVLHRVRGSFAAYTADNPLFGKYVGKVWRPPHIKGNRGKGEVKKRYKI